LTQSGLQHIDITRLQLVAVDSHIDSERQRTAVICKYINSDDSIYLCIIFLFYLFI